MLTCVLQNFLEHFSNSRSYLVIPLKYFFCKLLAGSRTLYKYIYIYRLPYVVVGVVVGATTVLKVILRKSYCGRLLVSRNFGDRSEIVSVVSKDTDCGGLNKVN